MKKREFKLIKSYPNSENIGSIYKQGDFMGRPVYVKDGDYLDPADVENNPEFFEEIVEKKEVFLITEDGVKINLKGEIHWVSNYVEGEIKYLYATSLVEPHLFILEDFKVFSSFEKAQEWIVFNKPVLSLKDVASIYPGINKEHNTPSHQAEQLKELVKSRL